MKCESCKYWSEMVAGCNGCGPIEALCLCEGGPNRGAMTTKHDVCLCHEKGVAIDILRTGDCGWK